MADAENKGHITPKKNIRVFIRRKRLSTGYISRSNSSSSVNSIEKLTSIIRKNCNRNKKNIIVVNYKPVFVRSRQHKSTNDKSSPTPPPTPNPRRFSMTTTPSSDHSKTNSSYNRKSVSSDVPDVEDPLMFIEMMYQQLFTEDGQLRSGTEPTVLANRVKQIVTQSRRNSMARRDSLTPNVYQPRYSSISSSPRFPCQPFSEDEEPQTLSQRIRTTNTSRRSSKRSSIDHDDHHHQQLHALLNSYYHRQKRTSINHSTINANSQFSVDDTDNDDLDTFSDLNSYRKTIRNSPPASIDEATTVTDSKHLPSSGYHSLRSPSSNIPQIHIEKDQHCCPNCIQSPQITVIPSPTTSSISLIQPIREIVVKYLNFILISKNILLVPLLIFLLRQRSMPISN